MAKKSKKTKLSTQTDSGYFLKLVLYMVLGSQWLFITDIDMDISWDIPIPVGLIIGLLFTAHEHFKLDRKIEYAILLMSCLVGYWSGVGLSVAVS